MKLYFCVLAIFLGVFINSALTDNPQTIPANQIPPTEVLQYSGARQQRLHHNLFHNIRMNWALLDALEQKQIADLGWKPVFISFSYINGDINLPVTLYGPTGEDFLWMHRKMINNVNRIAAEAESSWEVEGWTACPDPNDPVWPLPGVPDDLDPVADSWYIGYLQGYKSDEKLAEIRQRESELTTRAAGMTLGEFGTLLEYELHTDFHVRFAAWNPVGYRQQSLHPTERIDERWDDLRYDYLADFYSAHVNPTFWKIHGWIELKIVDWCSANGLSSAQCETSLPWTSQWESGPMQSEILTALEKVAEDAKARRANPDYDPATGTTNKKKHDAGVIVGSVFGGLVLGFIIALIAFYCMLKFKLKGGHVHTNPHTHEVKPLRGDHTQVNQDENIEVGRK